MKKQIHRRSYQRVEPKYDYMKYWRTIRKYIMVRYDLKEPQLEMLMFLYSEHLFTYYKFKEHANLFGLDRHMFKDLKERKFIHMFRDKVGNEHRLYEITLQGRRMITEMYKKLNMEEEISEVPKNNPVFNRLQYSHKVLALAIRKFNEEVRKKKGYKVTEY